MQSKPLIVVVGETASGKSALAMELAHQFNGEIGCADSWTVYTGFDIGTAKPSKTDREEIPHHLLDVASPSEGFSVAVFKAQAQLAIENILSRGKLPILAGGAGLYIDSVLYDYGFLEQPDPIERKKLDAMDLQALLEYAQELGLSLAGIDVRNRRRVCRHIENRGERPTKKMLRHETLILGLRIPRSELTQRIETRVDAMLKNGLEDEVRELAKRYGWNAEPMKGIGYREWREYFEGSQDLALTRQRIIQGNTQLARKQRTWFKRNNSIQWVSSRSKAVDLVTTFLNN
jgi:tRNA dimethylallyltransferase